MMASALFAPDLFSRRRISLAEIDVVVSARLGNTTEKIVDAEQGVSARV
jgi:hypothetical protein